MQLSSGQLDVLASDGHVLVTGGPGSGKTTVAILKAARIARENKYKGQRILFLSFARATVSRVIEAIGYEQEIARAERECIDVDTYHSFFWRILKTHGYLIGLPRRISILTPPAESIALSSIRSSYPRDSKLTKSQRLTKRAAEQIERNRLARIDGQICFDLFAPFVGELLHGSTRIRSLVSSMFPSVIFDEFQDTNSEQWNVVRALGEHSRLIALADPEQRIYDFIGADPKRLDHFCKAFSPLRVDLSSENHRSPGTDIATFGNDVLSGNLRSEYKGVYLRSYPPNPDQAVASLMATAYAARKRLAISSRKDWSLAILVPTKKMTRFVSGALHSPPAGMAEIRHVAMVELEGAILGAEVIAFLMQPGVEDPHFATCISLLCNYYHGRGGDTPAQQDINQASALRKAYSDWVRRKDEKRKIRARSILTATRQVYRTARALNLIGDPERDWKALRSVLEDGTCPRLKALAMEVRSLRLLDRGTQLRQELGQDWRGNGRYRNALAIVQRAFVQEHFASSGKPERGIVGMNMHKAKGKQFDEVILFEGWPRIVKGEIVANIDRFVRNNVRDEINDQARQNFRVSVTRGKSRVTILTPQSDPCVLLIAGR